MMREVGCQCYESLGRVEDECKDEMNACDDKWGVVQESECVWHTNFRRVGGGNLIETMIFIESITGKKWFSS